jgi:hypothetical protein
MNNEHERNKAKLAAELDRHEPKAEPFDFWSLVPDYGPGDKSAWEAAQAREGRLARLKASGVIPAITEEDVRWIVDGALPMDTQALREVRLWHSARMSGRASALNTLVLVGMRGRGKTVAAAWLIANVDTSGCYCTAEQLRLSRRGTRAEERVIYHRALKAGCLVVDEIGREDDLPSADGALFDVINGRRGRLGYRRSWTVLAGNISEDVFKARYDESTISKVLQTGMVVTCHGDDLRVSWRERMQAAQRGPGK